MCVEELENRCWSCWNPNEGNRVFCADCVPTVTSQAINARLKEIGFVSEPVQVKPGVLSKSELKELQEIRAGL